MNAPSKSINETTVTIVGAGIAGAATAFFLSQCPGFRVRILEKEPSPGLHATSRNAAMIRQLVVPADLAMLAAEGTEFIEQWARKSADNVFRCTGGIIAGDEAALRELTDASIDGLETTPVAASDMSAHIPGWHPSKNDHSGILVHGDGVVDVAALHEYFLREAQRAGAELKVATCVEDIVVKDERVHSVVTKTDTLPTDVLINAAGPWAGELAALAGGTSIVMSPRKRHLHWTGPIRQTDPDAPYFWDVTHNFYFRPESGGMLLCACEEETEEPGDAQPSDDAIEVLYHQLSRHAPWLSDIPIARTWAGLRTFAPDDAFLIGWDPSLSGFYWVAGLGGHGITTSAAVGRLAAEEVSQGRHHSAGAHSPFSPCRFAQTPARKPAFLAREPSIPVPSTSSAQHL